MRENECGNKGVQIVQIGEEHNQSHKEKNISPSMLK